MSPLLSVRGLGVRIGEAAPIDSVSFEVGAGEMLGIVGESGSGKSLTLRALLRLLPPGARTTGAAEWNGRDLLGMAEADIRGVRGREIAMIYQEPMTALDPVLPIGSQITESLAVHLGLRGAAARARAVGLLDRVGIPAAKRRLDNYPHEFSGGMRQRVMIAIALAAEPKLLLADEPTTALDVTIQDQILQLLLQLKEELGMGVILVTHDLGIVAGTCDRVAVMYAGRIMESGPVYNVFRATAHAYTLGLMRSVPSRAHARQMLSGIAGSPPESSRMPVGCRFAPRCGFVTGACGDGPPPLVEIGRGPSHGLPERRTGTSIRTGRGGVSGLLVADDLTRAFAGRRSMGDFLRGAPPMVRALNGVSLQLGRGETLAIVGESGCGKSTLARALVRLIELDGGQITFDGVDVGGLSGAELRRYNRRVQMVFQDPYGSLNPRMTVGQILLEALSVHRMVPPERRAERVEELLGLVRLPSDAASRLPHEFSGGQRQRIAIARALSIEPEILIADEIVSALDVSVQAQILNLLLDLQNRLGLAILFVSHDLRVVRHLAHRVAIMYLGRVVEMGPADAVFDAPRHPYTQALLRAAPSMEPPLPGTRRPPPRAALAGELPSPLNIPPGCPFHPRCPRAEARCASEAPRISIAPPEHMATCHFADI